MESGVTQERKQEIIREFGGSDNNTGSTEAQIAIFTERIKHITEHLKKHKKDYSSTRALVKLVGKRKRLLKYLAQKNLDSYRSLIKQLKIRR